MVEQIIVNVKERVLNANERDQGCWTNDCYLRASHANYGGYSKESMNLPSYFISLFWFELKAQALVSTMLS